ncbi:MAG TPA: CADD family putative folate metabolism protein [Terriglobales bacterium]|nr:CADD family putative folate metabolism protein [Terriglobales bacterium]
MELNVFWQELQSRISKYDLLCHPFYQAWSEGTLTREDLREYAGDYYHHVAAFPTYLAALYSRLPEGELRRAMVQNLADEEGLDGNPASRAHSEMWLDFAEGMGASRAAVRSSEPVAEIAGLTDHFRRIAREGSTAEALAAFYAYESQVPRVAKEKARGLREMYGADAKTCGYFTLHTTADVYHSNVWREHLSDVVEGDAGAQEKALVAAENAARSLWRALDGVERERLQRAA